MKPLTLAAIAALSMSNLFAQDSEKKPRHERPLPVEVVLKYDADGDGKLSKEERETMREEIKAKREAHKKEMLEKYDADKDGKLDKEEREAARAAHFKEVLEKYDTDDDGKLSEEEREAIPIPFHLFFGGPRGGNGEGRPPGKPEKHGKPSEAPEEGGDDAPPPEGE